MSPFMFEAQSGVNFPPIRAIYFELKVGLRVSERTITQDNIKR
jgi:hypothetical protein